MVAMECALDRIFKNSFYTPLSYWIPIQIVILHFKAVLLLYLPILLHYRIKKK